MHSIGPFSEACERNREPILAVLALVFADRRRVLEIGSGTGQHAAYFGRALSHLTWQASDVVAHLSGIRMWGVEPIELDVDQPWPAIDADAAFSANTAHIMSWAQVQRMFEQLGRRLPAAGLFAPGQRITPSRWSSISLPSVSSTRPDTSWWPMETLDSAGSVTSWPSFDSLPRVDLEAVGALTPEEVLYDFDGPCIFTAFTAQRTLVLAYLSEELENDKLLRFIVATTSEATVSAMKDGAVSVRGALERGSLWVVDLDYGYKPQSAVAARVNELPVDALPHSTTMLSTSTS